MLCAIHTGRAKPDVCLDCLRYYKAPEPKPLLLQLTDTISGVLRRVVRFHPVSGKSRIDFEVVGDLNPKPRKDSWW